MSDVANTIEQLMTALGRALGPLGEGLATDAEVLETVAEIGVTLPNAPPALLAVGTSGEALADALTDLEETIEAYDEGTATEGDLLAKLAPLGLALAAFITAVGRLQTDLGAQLPANIVAATHLPDTAVRKLLDNFIIVALKKSLPLLSRIFYVLGLFEEIPRAADPAVFQPEYLERTLRLDRIGQLLTDPLALMRDVYGWGTPALNVERLFEALSRLSFIFVAPAEIRYVGDSFRAFIAPSAPPPSSDTPEPMLVIPILEAGPLTLSIGVYPVPKASAGEQQGIALLLTGALGGTITIPLAPALSLELEGEIDLATGVAAVLRPDVGPRLVTGDPPLAITGGRGAVKLTWGLADTPTRLLGIPGGSRFEVRQIMVGGGVEVRGGQPDVTIDATLSGGRIVITMSEADGFLAKTLPQDGISFDFGFGIHWSQRNGLRLEGSGGLETTLALNLDLGPIRIQSLLIGLHVSGDGLTLELGVTGGLNIGPVAATVDRVGVKGTLAFHQGNLGPVDLGLGFKPPTGLGIVVAAGPVNGGGYISFDYDKGRYAGVLQLEVFGISVKAIGLLDTKMPDGRPGFSFLLIITTEFSPIQLGYGFTLLGVGGLAGINRTINAEALRNGIYTGSLDHILFPQDPVRNAPQLISDLSLIFPPAEGHYVFGPMAKLGWGTPTLVEISLGIIIELPDPLRIALLGQIAAYLPTKEAALVELHIDFMAMIDFAAKLLSLDATLRDSRIVVFTLTGDMALRLYWGDPPNFAVALGGFHPHFQTPPGFPALRRLQLALGAGDWIRLTCQAYQALTPNTLQFGARVDLYVNVGVYVKGWIGFDALFIFSPFSFEVDFTAGLEIGVGGVKLAGVSLDGSLSGPTPWRIKGRATISILFFEVTASVDEKFGDEQQVALPPADPWEPLHAALIDPRNWAATLPSGAVAVVSVAPPKDSDEVLVDPCGRAAWRQKVVPLDRTVTKFGNASTPAPAKFTVDRVTVSAAPVPFSAVSDFFAPAQFQKLSDAEKLSRPSFEPMQAGVALDDDEARIGPAIGAEIEYETKLIDSELESRRGSRYRFDAYLHLSLAGSAEIARSQLLHGGTRAFAAGKRLDQDDDAYLVVSMDDLQPHPAIQKASSKGKAAEALAALVAGDPAARGRWQVVPANEVAP